MMFLSCQNTFFLIVTEGIIMHISHPAKVGLVVLRLEPTAQSLGGWSYAPSPLRRGSELSFRDLNESQWGGR